MTTKFNSLNYCLKIDKTGALGYKEFRALWMILRQWKVSQYSILYI